MSTKKETVNVGEELRAAKRYTVNSTFNGTCKIYDRERKCHVMQSISPRAKYNLEAATKIVELLNKSNNS